MIPAIGTIVAVYAVVRLLEMLLTKRTNVNADMFLKLATGLAIVVIVVAYIIMLNSSSRY